MTTKDYITLAIALIGAITGITGAVLGIINTRHALLKDRETWEVSPRIEYLFPIHLNWPSLIEQPEAELFAGVDVTNLSQFPISITSVQAYYYDEHTKEKGLSLSLEDHIELPKRIEARSLYGFKFKDAPIKIPCTGHLQIWVSSATHKTITTKTEIKLPGYDEDRERGFQDLKE